MQILDGQPHSWAPKPQPKSAAIPVSDSGVSAANRAAWEVTHL
jgi:hypothetical protein